MSQKINEKWIMRAQKIMNNPFFNELKKKLMNSE